MIRTMFISMRNALKAKVKDTTNNELKNESRENGRFNTHDVTAKVVGTNNGTDGMNAITKETAATNVNIPGLKYVLGRRVPVFRRLIWLAVLCGMTYLLYRQCHKRVEYFLTHPTSETSRLVYPQKLRFPAVTVCNQNMFRASSALNPVRPDENPAIRPVLVYELMHKFFEAVNNNSMMNQYLADYSHLMSEETTLVGVYRNFGHQLKDFLVSCKFKGSPCKDEWIKEVITDAGLCFTFNSVDDNALHTELQGHRGGLQIELNYEIHEYLHSVTAHPGAIVLIHDQAESSRLVRNKGITIPAGFSVSIGLSVSNRTSDGKDHGRCGNSPLKNFPPSQRYLRSICELDCLTEYIKAECGCLDVYMPDYKPMGENKSQVRRCSMKDTLTCVFLKTDQFPSSPDYLSYCQCETPCEMTMFEKFVSFAMTSLERSALKAAKQNPDDPVVSEYRTGRLVNDWAFLLNVDMSYPERIHNVLYQGYDTIVKLMDVTEEVGESVSTLQSSDLAHPLVSSALIEAINRTNWNELFMKMDNMAVRYNRRLHSRDALYDPVTVGSVLTANELLSNIPYRETTLADMMGLVFHMRNKTIKLQNAIADPSTIPESNRLLFRKILMAVTNASVVLETLVIDASHIQKKYETLRQEIQNRFGAIYDHWNQKTMSSQFIRENYGTVSVYFQELYVHEIKESTTFDLIALTCDLGGSLGLCLGGSLLTLVEIVDLFFGRCFFSARVK